MRANGRVSQSFDVTYGVRQRCVLASAPFNLQFDALIHMLPDSQSKGVGTAYLHNVKLVGNLKKLQLETLANDLKYADDMSWLADYGMT